MFVICVASALVVACVLSQATAAELGGVLIAYLLIAALFGFGY